MSALGLAALGATQCDYCHQPLIARAFQLRAVGIEPDAIPHPQPIVKAWCGTCTPDDRIDAGAHHLLTRALTPRTQADRLVSVDQPPGQRPSPGVVTPPGEG